MFPNPFMPSEGIETQILHHCAPIVVHPVTVCTVDHFGTRQLFIVQVLIFQLRLARESELNYASLNLVPVFTGPHQLLSYPYLMKCTPFLFALATSNISRKVIT